jgi:hypothetical protein
LPEASNRPLGGGPAYFVDPVQGSDDGDGTKDKAWMTINHALQQISAGDTLYLRGERYVGPGIWYNGATGRIHTRLAHYTPTEDIGTRTPLTLKYLPHRLHKLESYQGETDPRKLPLEIAPFHSVPLLIDGAQHVKFQDLVIRGGGHDTVDIQHGQTVEFDNVIIYAGTYGLRARNTGPLRFTNSAIRGSVPPWSTRGETSLREYPWRVEAKNLTRLNTDVYVYRNILDGSTVVSDHGGPPWESMRWYHNTILANPRFILSSRTGGRPWQVFNNLLLVGNRTEGKPQDGAAWGGNIAGDPNFAKPEDFRLPPGSQAIDAGVPIPNDWPDPLRSQDKGNPDAGAIPLGGAPLKVGRHGRLSF